MNIIRKRVGPRGSTSASVMVVGEAPGANEERLGKPFIGAAGDLLDECLLSQGFDLGDIFYTNLAKERPPNNNIGAFFGKGGVPNEIIMSGLAELKAEIEVVKPKIIIPLGSHPLRFLTGKGHWNPKAHGYTGIGDYRGSILEGSPITGGAKCLPTFHPANVLREYSNKAIVKLDLSRAAKQSKFSEIRRPLKAIVVDPTGIDREAWRAWLVSEPGTESPSVELVRVDPFRGNSPTGIFRTFKSDGFLTGDIEGFGPKLLCLGLTRHSDVAVTFITSGPADIEFIRGILECGVPLCFQNGMFDCSLLEYFQGIRCVRHLRYDTMIAMHAAYTEFPKNLGFIGSIFTELPMWWESVNWKAIKAGQTSIDVVWPYNANDTWVTHDAMVQMLGDELKVPAIQDTNNFESSLLNPLWETSLRGVRIDTERLERLKVTLTNEANDLTAGVSMLAGKAVNLKSGPQVADFVYETLKVPKVGPKTPSGQWQMSDDALALLSLKCTTDRQRTGIRMVRDGRERRDLISKFCDIELDDDGRMRCHYDPAKTQFGRLSSKKFYPTDRGTNLQNVPRDPRVRSVFVPDPGYAFGYADLKQAESLVVAHITGDPQMLYLHSDEYLFGGKDGHKYVAAYIFGKLQEHITKDERFIGKKIRHACNYVMGWFRLMQIINAETQKTGVSITAAQAKAYVAKYRALHHELEPWWRWTTLQLVKKRYLETLPKLVERENFPWLFENDDRDSKWMVRPHTFFGRIDEITPEAVSFRPQGTVADVLNIGLVRAARDKVLNDLGFQLLLQVHDAVGYQMPEQNINLVNKRLKELMRVDVQCERPGIEPFTFNIPVDIQVGENWGESDSKEPHPVNPNGLVIWKEVA